MKLCPKCHSTNIDLYMGGQFGKYICKKCNYIGNLILEIKKKNGKRKINKKNT